MSNSYPCLYPRDMLQECCGWLLSQYQEPGLFRALEWGKPIHEWYMFFYPVRTLLLGARLLGKDAYRQMAFKVIDTYLAEQLPNGAFTSNFRNQPQGVTQDELEEILRCGKVNVADVGSNVTAVVAAADQAEPARRQKYLDAVRRWLDQWLVLWALPEGGYGNGIWCGHKLNSPYTCAMSTAAMALSAFARATGEERYARLASRCMRFQCSQWCEETGVPINLDCYPLPRQSRLVDYGHSFYLLEGLCWTHAVSPDPDVKALIERRLTQWILGPQGLLSQWNGSWFDFAMCQAAAGPGEMPSSRSLGIRPGWELAKSNGIPHAFSYYLLHVHDEPRLRGTVDKGIDFLTCPAKARMSGVMSDPEESYGAFAVQATGFAGLSLAQVMAPDAVFAVGPQ